MPKYRVKLVENPRAMERDTSGINPLNMYYVTIVEIEADDPHDAGYRAGKAYKWQGRVHDLTVEVLGEVE